MKIVAGYRNIWQIHCVIVWVKYEWLYRIFYDVSMEEIFLTLPFFLCTNEQLSDC